MRFPVAQVIPQTRDTMTVFKGLNMTPSVPDGEFSGMQNMAGDLFPVLSPRGRRWIVPRVDGSYHTEGDTFTKCNGITSVNDKLLFVDVTHLWYGTADKGEELTDTAKTFVRMGARVLIFPDKKVYNAEANTIRGILVESSMALCIVGGYWLSNYILRPCDKEGNLLTYTSAPSSPAIFTAGDLWRDTINNTMYQYSAENGWVEYTDYYQMVVLSDFVAAHDGFKVDDHVTITHTIGDETVEAYEGDVVGNGTYTESSTVFDYIIITRATKKSKYTAVGSGPNYAGAYVVINSAGTTIVSNKTPSFGSVFVESNNRAWGCSEDGHELYACRLGDPFNWYDFSALSTASQAITVGTEGPFTGAANVNGYPVFFKENCIHVIIGSGAPFSLTSYDGWRGVQKGSERSIAVINGICYYKGVDGIYAFDGAQAPVLISKDITGEWYDAVGGADGDKYFVSMKDAAGNWSLFVYDTKSGMWYREDAVQISFADNVASNSLFVVGQKLFSRNHYAGIDSLTGTGSAFVATQENAFDWYAESGDVLALYPDHKYVTQLQVTLEMAADSTLSIAFMYDGDGVWRPGISLTGAKLKGIVIIPVKPRRCQYFKYKISGHGEAKVYSVTKVMEQGA
jgi:hypothetical protein